MSKKPQVSYCRLPKKEQKNIKRMLKREKRNIEKEKTQSKNRNLLKEIDYVINNYDILNVCPTDNETKEQYNEFVPLKKEISKQLMEEEVKKTFTEEWKRFPKKVDYMTEEEAEELLENESIETIVEMFPEAFEDI